MKSSWRIVGLPEDVDKLELAEPAVTHRMRSFDCSDSTIVSVPLFRGQVRTVSMMRGAGRAISAPSRELSARRPHQRSAVEATKSRSIAVDCASWRSPGNSDGARRLHQLFDRR